MKVKFLSPFRSIVPAVVFACFMTACGSDEDPIIDYIDTIAVTPLDTNAVDNALQTSKAENIFYSIPSPVEMATMLQKLGAEYEYGYLNDVQSSDKYFETTKQALNLGVYGADLSYTCIFNQSNESIYYMEVNRKLAEKLDVSSAIDNQTVERFDANIGNRDSVLAILSETFWRVDEYLKENDRQHISILIIAGGWLEGMHLTTLILDKNSDNEDAKAKLAEQKFSLDNLIALVEMYKNEPMLDETLADLKSLRDVYNSVSITRENASVETDVENELTVIGGTNKIDMDDATLKAIGEKIHEIREKIVSI